METKKRLTKEQVDNEIRKLEESRRQVCEDNDIYKIKKENLHAIRKLVTRGEETWENTQKINSQ